MLARPFSHASHSAHHGQRLRESASQQLMSQTVRECSIFGKRCHSHCFTLAKREHASPAQAYPTMHYICLVEAVGSYEIQARQATGNKGYSIRATKPRAKTIGQMSSRTAGRPYKMKSIQNMILNISMCMWTCRKTICMQLFPNHYNLLAHLNDWDSGGCNQMVKGNNVCWSSHKE